MRMRKKENSCLISWLQNSLQITSLMYVINSKKNDSLNDQNPILYRGDDHIIEEMDGLEIQDRTKIILSDQYKARHRFSTVSQKILPGLQGKR